MPMHSKYKYVVDFVRKVCAGQRLKLLYICNIPLNVQFCPAQPTSTHVACERLGSTSNEYEGNANEYL